MCIIKGDQTSVGLGPHIHTKDWGLIKELMGGVWFA